MAQGYYFQYRLLKRVSYSPDYIVIEKLQTHVLYNWEYLLYDRIGTRAY